MSIAQKIASGFNTSGILVGSTLAKSADYTVLSTDVNVFLVTTASTNRTMTLPAASAVAGQVYRFTKVDSGTGKVILARDGSDTIGINANLTMELWFQDNYVDIMSDGTSRWIVVSTEMFMIPDVLRQAVGNPAIVVNQSTQVNTWVDADYSTHPDYSVPLVPAGTADIQLFSYLKWVGDGNTDAVYTYLRKNGSDSAANTKTAAQWGLFSDRADNHYLAFSNFPIVSCDIGRIFEWYIYPYGGTPDSISFHLSARGYRLG